VCQKRPGGVEVVGLTLSVRERERALRMRETINERETMNERERDDQ
jgi:hypothetical protein